MQTEASFERGNVSEPGVLRELLLAECALKAKRLLALGLREHGFDLDSPILGERLSLELSRGAGLVGTLRARMRPAEVAYLFGERAFGVQRAALMGRLPYLLAHGYHMVELLARLGDPTTPPSEELCFAGGAFNLACVLLDHITDRMRAADQIQALLSTEALLELCRDDGDTEPLARIAAREPVDELNVFARVLALFVMPAFGETSGGGQAAARRDQVATLLARGYAAQLATAVRGGDAPLEEVRIKSVTPHLLLGHLAAMSLPDEARAVVLRLATLTGELFGLLDDLIDVGEDALDGHANAVMASARSRQPGAEELLLLALDTPVLPEAARRLLATIVALVEETPREQSSAAAEQWLQFLFAYVARAYR